MGCDSPLIRPYISSGKTWHWGGVPLCHSHDVCPSQDACETACPGISALLTSAKPFMDAKTLEGKEAAWNLYLWHPLAMEKCPGFIKKYYIPFLGDGLNLIRLDADVIFRLVTPLGGSSQDL